MEPNRMDRLKLAREFKCETCFFFEIIDTKPDAEGNQRPYKGVCRRFPGMPQGGSGTWGPPIMRGNEWCGEWTMEPSYDAGEDEDMNQ